MRGKLKCESSWVWSALSLLDSLHRSLRARGCHTCGRYSLLLDASAFY